MGSRIGILAGAHVAQLVEHILGKDEVISSILIMGSIFKIEQLEISKQSRLESQ